MAANSFFPLKCLGCQNVISSLSDTANCPICDDNKFHALIVEPDPYRVSTTFLRQHGNAEEEEAVMLLSEDKAYHLLTSCWRKGYMQHDRCIYIELQDNFLVNLVDANRYLSGYHVQNVGAPAFVMLPYRDPASQNIQTSRKVVRISLAPPNYHPDHFFSIIPQKQAIPPVAESFFSTFKTITQIDGDDCTICLGCANGSMVKLSCKHAFHDTCIREWLKMHARCPNCKIAFPTKCPDYNTWLDYKKKGGGDGAGGGSGGSTSLNA